MNTSFDLAFARHANAFERALSLEAVRERAPAAFALSADESLSRKYTFIPTAHVLSGLMQSGFVPVDARQTKTRSASALHARHIIRLRRRLETVALRDSVPEVVFWNSHDGSSSYQLRIGIFRVVCENGLIASRGAFPSYCVSHRGDVVEEVIGAALRIAERFGDMAAQVGRMEQRVLCKEEQIRFAEKALALRFPDLGEAGMEASQLLACRRVEDLGNDLWTAFNRCQENLTGGGLRRRAQTGRLTRTRRITSIRESVRLNSGLWDLATEVLAA